MNLETRPTFPDAEDERRYKHCWARHKVLEEDWDDVLEEWASIHVGPERLAKWGPLDTSSNFLSNISKQLTTPGHYGERPTPRHPDDRADPLVKVGGLLDQAGWATKLQRLQYFCTGMGDYLIRASVTNGKASLRLVPAHMVYDRANPSDPTDIWERWELRLRWHEVVDGDGRYVWAWDQYCIEPGKEPTYRVMAKLDAGPELTDLSHVYLKKTGGLNGTEYPFRHTRGPKAGQLRLPYAKYRSVDSSNVWNWKVGRDDYLASLNIALLHSYALHSARDASGTMVLVAGVKAPGGNVSTVDGTSVVSLPVTSGSMLFLELDGNHGLQTVEIGPGGQLEPLSTYAHQYEIRAGVRMGLAPADIIKQHANPTSGAALAISERGKRAYSRQTEELYRSSDLDLLELLALLFNLDDGHLNLPESGYSLTYAKIGATADEEQGERDQLDWEQQKGHKSEVDVYIAKHPGTSPEAAVAELVRVRVDQARLKLTTDEALQAAGLNVDTAGVERRIGEMEFAKSVAVDVGAGALALEVGRGLLASMLGLTGDEVAKILPDDAGGNPTPP
jgi:hypothetical protein